MLFLSSWGWARRDVLNNRKWTRGAHTQGVIEQVSSGYRGLNRELVRAAVLAVLQRRAERTARLERLAGETVRLPGRTGREKDYHRLLVNDVELCVDIVGWRDLVGVCDASAAFRRTFVKPGVVNEPGYAKTRGRGRLDILLSADPAAEGRKELWLATPERGPVAWIELEAGGIHLHQIQEFIQGHGEHLQPGDYVCAIDQSPDDHPQVAEARGFVEAAGATFLHSQVPNAFSRLEEAYAPGMHRLSRKRYTLEVIRGLLS
jgi:hypothetical protein